MKLPFLDPKNATNPKRSEVKAVSRVTSFFCFQFSLSNKSITPDGKKQKPMHLYQTLYFNTSSRSFRECFIDPERRKAEIVVDAWIEKVIDRID